MRKPLLSRNAVPNLEWKAAAIADLLAIIDYISDENPGAAQALKDKIEDKASRLMEHPRMYRADRVNGTREMVVYPNYVVIYSDEPGASQFLWLRGCGATSPPLEEVGPPHVFEAASYGEQGVGTRHSRVFRSRSGIDPC